MPSSCTPTTTGSGNGGQSSSGSEHARSRTPRTPRGRRQRSTRPPTRRASGKPQHTAKAVRCPPATLQLYRIAGRAGHRPRLHERPSEESAQRQQHDDTGSGPKPVYISPNVVLFTRVTVPTRANGAVRRCRTRSPRPSPALRAAGRQLSEPPQYLVRIYKAAARRYRLPWPVLAAINYVETGYGADVNYSSAGAMGWMQFMPGTWREYGEAIDVRGHLMAHVAANPWNPRDAIFSAAHLVANGAHQDPPGDLRLQPRGLVRPGGVVGRPADRPVGHEPRRQGRKEGAGDADDGAAAQRRALHLGRRALELGHPQGMTALGSSPRCSTPAVTCRAGHDPVAAAAERQRLGRDRLREVAAGM